jgi:hypothetical protein
VIGIVVIRVIAFRAAARLGLSGPELRCGNGATQEIPRQNLKKKI